MYMNRGVNVMDKQTVQTNLCNYFCLFLSAYSIIIAYRQIYLYDEPSVNLDLQINTSDLLPEKSITKEAMDKGYRVKEVIEHEEIYMSYRAISEPIFIGKEIVGAMTAIYPLHATTLHLPYITVRTKDRWVPIHLDDIVYLEAYNRKTSISSSSYKGTHRDNLTEVEAKLPAENFLRCHRSYIVNLHQIKEIHPDSHSTFILKMSNEERVPVSQSYSKRFRQLLDF